MDGSTNLKSQTQISNMLMARDLSTRRALALPVLQGHERKVAEGLGRIPWHWQNSSMRKHQEFCVINAANTMMC